MRAQLDLRFLEEAHAQTPWWKSRTQNLDLAMQDLGHFRRGLGSTACESWGQAD